MEEYEFEMGLPDDDLTDTDAEFDPEAQSDDGDAEYQFTDWAII